MKLRLNAEIQKYIWQDFSFQRVMAPPLILGALAFLMYNSPEIAHQIYAPLLGLGAYFFFIAFWGSYRACLAVTGELRAKTWDQQLLSSVSPLSLLVGKLFGSTLFAWWGASVGLAIWLYLQPFYHSLTWLSLGLLLVGGILCHAICLLFSLRLLWGTRESLGHFHSVFCLVFSIAFTFQLYYQALGEYFIQISFWSQTYDAYIFLLISLSVFLAWTLIALFRSFSVELGLPKKPWAWPCFCIFLTWYCCGIVKGINSTSDKTTFLILGVLILLGLLQLSLFFDKLRVVHYQKLFSLFQKGLYSNFFLHLPIWVPNFILLTSGVLIALFQIPQFSTTFIILLLLGIRDIGLLHYFFFAHKTDYARLGATVCLFTLYVLAPGILRIISGQMQWGDIALSFMPLSGTPTDLEPLRDGSLIFLTALQVALMWFLTLRRFHKN